MHICRNLCRDVLAQPGLEPGQAMKRTTMCIRAEIPHPNIALNIEIGCWSCGARWFSRFKKGRDLLFFFCPFLLLPQHKTEFLLFPSFFHFMYKDVVREVVDNMEEEEDML